jgi:hypothetical protein
LQRRIVQRRTALQGAEIILTGDSMKAVVDGVHQGKCVGFVADQDAGENGLFVDFFGCPASTARGPALFAVTLGIPLVPMFMVRDTTPERRLVLHVGEPLFADQAADRKAEVRRLTEAHTRQLEDAVRQHPADYFWLHRRWKTRPSVKQGKAPLEAVPTSLASPLPGAALCADSHEVESWRQNHEEREENLCYSARIVVLADQRVPAAAVADLLAVLDVDRALPASKQCQTNCAGLPQGRSC